MTAARSGASRALLAGALVLLFAAALLLFLNYVKFTSALENRERARHALLAGHLAKIFETRLALGLALDDSPAIRTLLTGELAGDPRLRALAVLDAQGATRIAGGAGQPALWQAARAAKTLWDAPVENEAGALAVGLHNGFGADAGWLVLEYDLREAHRQALRGLAGLLPATLLSLLLALAVLAFAAPPIMRRYAQQDERASRRLGWLVAVLLIAMQCAIGWNAYRTLAGISGEEAPRLAATLAHTLMFGLEGALRAGIPLAELRGVDEWLLSALAAGPEFARLGIEDLKANRLFDAGKPPGSPSGVADYRFPLVRGDETVGSLVVSLDTGALAERTRQLLIEFATLLIIGVLVGMEALHGMLARATLAGVAGVVSPAGLTSSAAAGKTLARWRLPLFLFFAGSELPRAFLPMWAQQLAQKPLPASWSGTPLATLFQPLVNLPDAVLTTLPISLFLLAIALISPFAGRLGGRMGSVRLLRLGLSVAFFGHLFALLAESMLTLSLARVLAGIGSGFVTVAALEAIGRSGARARGMALYLTAYVAAGICGTGLGALLVERAGTASVFAFGMMCTVLAAVALGRMPAQPPASREDALLRNVLRLLRQPRFVRLLLLVGLPLQILQQGLLFYWAPLALSAQGEPTSFVGLSMMAYFFLVLLFSGTAARWADRRGRHAAFALGGLAGAGVAALFCGVLPLPGAIVASILVIGFTWAAAFPAQGALLLHMGQNELDGVAPGVAIGVYRMLERFGAMLAPPLLALLIGIFGFAGTAELIGGLLLGCALLQGWLLRRERVS